MPVTCNYVIHASGTFTLLNNNISITNQAKTDSTSYYPVRPRAGHCSNHYNGWADFRRSLHKLTKACTIYRKDYYNVLVSERN